MSRPFNTSLRRGAGEPLDLIARIDVEVRERIGEAVDFVGLEALVQARCASGLPAPVADSASDRAEFEDRVETFLVRLADTMVAALDAERRQSLTASARAVSNRLERLIDLQVALAKLLPDYWQRFEAVRTAYASDPDAVARPSGRDRARWLDRFLDR